MNCPNPKCKASLKPGTKFCPSCGTEVAGVGEISADTQQYQGGAFPAAQTPAISSVIKASIKEPSTVKPLSTPSTPSGAMLCIDRLSILFEGCPSIVRFRVDTSRFCGDARNLRFTFENQLNGCKCSPRPLGRRGGLQEFSVTFPEQKAGGYVWYVTVESEGVECVKAFEGEIHLVVERQGEARKVADQLALNITTNITTGHAADVHMNQNAADALNKIVKSSDDPFQALRRLIASDERAWANVNLYEVDPPREDEPPQQAPERLTLTCGDEVLHLVSDSCVTFGRNRANVIPLRICGPDGHVDTLANECNISRFHFSIERIGCDCVLRDGSGGTPSSYGTRVNGVSLPPSGSKRLAAGNEIELEAGRCGVALKMRVKFRRDSHGQAAGFTLDRLDGAHQRVCAVWSEMPLEDGVSVLWNGCHWSILSGSSNKISLHIGTMVSISGKTFKVMPFQQTHLS